MDNFTEMIGFIEASMMRLFLLSDHSARITGLKVTCPMKCVNAIAVVNTMLYDTRTSKKDIRSKNVASNRMFLTVYTG